MVLVGDGNTDRGDLARPHLSTRLHSVQAQQRDPAQGHLQRGRQRPARPAQPAPHPVSPEGSYEH